MLLIMDRLRSKNGTYGNGRLFFLFLFFFCFFFLFLPNARFSSISRKRLEIKEPNLNMFVLGKNGCLENFFLPPRSKGPPRGQNGLKTNAPNDRENCQSVCYKILIQGTQGIGIEPF